MREPNAIVLVVDDDVSVREALGSLIRSAGLRVETFASAQEFLARPRADAPSCLVLDVRLPGLSGLDLQKRMAEINLEIPIVFITGHGDVPTSVQAMKAGALEFLTKPFDRQVLLETLGRATFASCRTQWNETNWFRLSALAVIGLLVADIHRWRLHQRRYGSQSELKA